MTKLFEDQKRLAACVAVGFFTKPVDDLTLSLLRLDQAGRVLIDMTGAGASPVRKFQTDLVNMFVEGQVADTLIYHFKMNEVVSCVLCDLLPLLSHVTYLPAYLPTVLPT